MSESGRTLTIVGYSLRIAGGIFVALVLLSTLTKLGTMTSLSGSWLPLLFGVPLSVLWGYWMYRLLWKPKANKP